ncbi:MAG: hypothetical protein JO254_11315 [Pseudolabrys sp.]|nr:hypothetical protein [Pseudolabrys sp.]
MPYNVYLVDITNRIGDDTRRNEVKAVLQAYFDKVAAKAKMTDTVAVQFVTDNPQPADNELIAYYSTSGWHVVSQMPGAPTPSTTEGGLTYFNGRVTGSDVVANPEDDTKVIANLTFHELMHNKLNKGDEMHRLGGLAKSPVDDSTPLTAANIDAMAGALKTSRKQWLGGFAALQERKKPASFDGTIR